MKTQTPEKYSGRPSLAYPSPQHFLEFVLRYMKVGGVPTGARVDYVTLQLLEGEARTWYDLRVKSVQNETFETFSISSHCSFNSSVLASAFCSLKVRAATASCISRAISIA